MAASASTSASSASSSTAFQIRPHSAAFSAGSGSPVSARPSARAWPTSRGRSQLPPLSGIRPIAEKLWMNLADLAAMTMSQASAMLAPAPAATPLTRAITGCGKRGERADQRVPVALDRLAEVDRLARRDRAVVEVLPGAEAAAGAGQDDHARIAEVGERVAQLLVHRGGEAVEPVGAVERDPRDAVVQLEVDGLVSHACRLAKEWAWTQT